MCELKLVVGPHRGRGADADAVTFPSLGQACHRYRDEAERYMNYTVGGECPSDEASTQRLMLKGYKPLRRRRCQPRTPAGLAVKSKGTDKPKGSKGNVDKDPNKPDSQHFLSAGAVAAALASSLVLGSGMLPGVGFGETGTDLVLGSGMLPGATALQFLGRFKVSIGVQNSEL
ncbi:hypothetical protein Zm00014a_009179 [Zea mays]|uniref:Uncharacterized protein n=1 Tax=Zea mays TaxID=4577 RepID=A0A3L6FH98_MAIZE|nr:hypothetical protein Zm00014a_009179 [Zea mays]